MAHNDQAARLLLEGDDVTAPRPVRRDGHPAAVDQYMAVAHELTGLRPAGAPVGPEDDVVEAQFQHAQKVFAGDPLLAVGLFVVVAELLLQDAVDAAGLLLFP